MPSESELHKSTGLHVTVRDPHGGEAINLNFDRDVTEIPLVVDLPNRTAKAVLKLHVLPDAGEYDVRFAFTTDPAKHPAAVAAVEKSAQDDGAFSKAEQAEIERRAAAQGYSETDLSDLVNSHAPKSKAEALEWIDIILSQPRAKLALACQQQALEAFRAPGTQELVRGVTEESYRLALELRAPVTRRDAIRILEDLVERAQAVAPSAGSPPVEAPLAPPATEARLPVETNVAAEVSVATTTVASSDTTAVEPLKGEAPKAAVEEKKGEKKEEKKERGGHGR